MPRQARLDAPGVLQHVMARGIERRKIFWDDKDRSSFLERLAVILEETQTQCYAWVLIPNHFHLLLRTGPTSLSTVMRRLMTGYAVTFNIRHRRSGHLFQNRYKSVICEENAYLLELIRYIHLNPLRAGLVNELKELDRYPWTGHSAVLGRRKNPLIPELPDKPVKSLAEKSVEDVLKHFGETFKIARRRYRQFVKKGIDQGKRPDLQGGGLVRSAGGDKRGLLGRKKGEREKGDQRILGSGDFVANVMKDANEVLDQTAKFDISLDELISRVCAKFEIRVKDLVSKSRKCYLSQARGVVCYLAVDELGYSGDDVARSLRISGRGVSDCRERGKKILDKPEIIGEYLA
jgi:REP element-mobilizing transposase RayT